MATLLESLLSLVEHIVLRAWLARASVDIGLSGSGTSITTGQKSVLESIGLARSAIAAEHLEGRH